METETTHADKYNDPRARITGRGLLIGIAVLVLAAVGAYFSITGRRTKIEKSTEFWGQETIVALQLGERFEIIPIDGEQKDPINLTAMPGLGLLRQALLEERNYEWDTQGNVPLSERIADAENRERIRFRLTDPNGKRFEKVELDLDLASGWIAAADGSKSVRMNAHTRPKLKNFLSTVMHAEQKRYDFRE
ncbi:hypothetical protein [Novipirellula caenicola]|uniref:DUF4340 domain-containing protein n=1 Tax=Novipirellula caenicola TaxID=1536901 RepID=A0ABP9VNJ5_9BACT